MDSIKNRRSIRKYKQDEIPASLLNDLLEEAFRASTTVSYTHLTLPTTPEV